ncbi:DHA1 family bicyclomycin/chloramphenicol resistance-like MFS transporter [Gracilibacillus halotolerans]|uniref:Bcr/CflA family efflux transporter n=1 Tax=Gracilibacillus halotolerans TaxID=74386 RepID=A0A841RMU3_9BACI|nr:multidrug effflux MFS transporter [Gracilibacillus halotolerans]MBB6512008.1 DHA1 family bicyclomycin/chloramphenicol resistance-like MFS transporter [Gracilibacillus halotolerans]
MTQITKKQSFRFALILGVFSALGPFTFDMYLPAFPEMAEYFNTSASSIQGSLTASLLGVGLGQIIIGTMSDVYGRRTPLFISMIVFTLASLACAFAPNILTLVIMRFIQGFAGAAGLVISRAIARDLYSGVELTKFFAMIVLVSSVAPLVAPLSGGMILSFTPWMGVFIFLTGLGVLLTAMTFFRLKETLPKEKRVPANLKKLAINFGNLLRNKVFMGYALTQGLMMSGIFAYVAGTPFIYQKIHGVSPQVFSILFAVNGIALIIGAQVVNRLAGKMKALRLLRIGLILAVISSAAVFIVILANGPLYAIVITLFCLLFSLGVINPIAFTLAIETQGHIAGSASALLGVLPFLLGSISSPLVGIAGEYSAIPFGIIIFTSTLLAACANIFLVRKG